MIIIIVIIINKQAFHLHSIICVQMLECMSSDGPHRRATDERTNKQTDKLHSAALHLNIDGLRPTYVIPTLGSLT